MALLESIPGKVEHLGGEIYPYPLQPFSDAKSIRVDYFRIHIQDIGSGPNCCLNQSEFQLLEDEVVGACCVSQVSSDHPKTPIFWILAHSGSS